MISEVMENGPRHTLQIGSDCPGAKGGELHGAWKKIEVVVVVVGARRRRRGGRGGGAHLATTDYQEISLRWTF